jgi:hypothetical protein
LDTTTGDLKHAAKAEKIMVIRHAEKPGKGAPPFGVDQEGSPDPESLAPLGWQRAGALTVLFAPAKGTLQDPALAVPRFLFACGNEPQRKRLRPLETIIPLARRLGIPVDTTFIAGEEEQLADAAMGSPGVVLISWEHKHIHLIANRILGDETTAPQAWPEERFDVVWVFDLQGGSYRFRQVPELLLSGDLDLGI